MKVEGDVVLGLSARTIPTAQRMRLAGIAIRKLEVFVSQRRLERLLGLSQGYLCRLKAGKQTPSMPIVALLVLLAASPEKRLQRLSALWERAHQDPPPQ